MVGTNKYLLIKEIVELLYENEIMEDSPLKKSMFYNIYSIRHNLMNKGINVTFNDLGNILFKNLRIIKTTFYTRNYFQVNKNATIYYRKLLKNAK